jgi:hypothetical protein
MLGDFTSNGELLDSRKEHMGSLDTEKLYKVASTI